MIRALHFEATIKPELMALRELRQTLKLALQKVKVSAERQEQSLLGATEWITNLVQHSTPTPSMIRVALIETVTAVCLMIEDDGGIFARFGAVDDYYREIDNEKFIGDLNFTSQIKQHLVEAGLGITYGTQRFYSIRPVTLGRDVRGYWTNDTTYVEPKSKQDRYERTNPYRYGFDLYGEKDGPAGDQLDAQNPLLGYMYVQDRFELEDIVLNLGLRVDYFDSQADIIADPENPYSGGSGWRTRWL